MTDHAWGVLSNQGIAAAAVMYFLALLCHLVEWSSTVGSPAGRAGRPHAAEPELVSAGRAASAGERAETSTAVVGDDSVGLETPTPGGSGGSAGGDEAGERRAAMLGRLGLLLTGIAVACHLVGVVSRGMGADPNRVPWGNMYEFTISGTLVVAAAYLILRPRLKLAWMAPLVTIFVLACLMVAVLWLYEPVAPLTEALGSYWLVIHVFAAMIATGAFTLGGLASLAYLVKLRWPEAEWLARVPTLDVLDRVSYRIHAFGFPVWTFAVLITGPIWAHQAWGSYWNWDPKEVWAFITWVVYAGYLHARATAGWKGKKAAILALVAVATLWFNFIGINYFSSTSQHSYANGAPAPAVPSAHVEVQG